MTKLFLSLPREFWVDCRGWVDSERFPGAAPDGWAGRGRRGGRTARSYASSRLLQPTTTRPGRLYALHCMCMHVTLNSYHTCMYARIRLPYSGKLSMGFISIFGEPINEKLTHENPNIIIVAVDSKLLRWCAQAIERKEDHKNIFARPETKILPNQNIPLRYIPCTVLVCMYIYSTTVKLLLNAFIIGIYWGVVLYANCALRTYVRILSLCGS